MAISFGSIGTVCATFQGTTCSDPGTICKWPSTAPSRRAAPETPSSAAWRTATDCCTPSPSAASSPSPHRTLPSYGINKLSADGNGGLQVDKENGQAYWIVQLDTVNKTITILL